MGREARVVSPEQLGKDLRLFMQVNLVRSLPTRRDEQGREPNTLVNGHAGGRTSSPATQRRLICSGHAEQARQCAMVVDHVVGL